MMRKPGMLLLLMLMALPVFGAPELHRYKVELKPSKSGTERVARALVTRFAAGRQTEKIAGDSFEVFLTDEEVAELRSVPDVTSVTVIPGTMAAIVAPDFRLGEFQYDGSGNITEIGTSTGTRAGTDLFTYDVVGRLIRAKLSLDQNCDPTNETCTERYGYDRYGNMTWRKDPAHDTVIQVDAATNHLVGRTYDGRGNDRGTTGNEEYTYDALNMLSRGATSDTRYLYTADDERIAIIKNETVAPTYTWTVRGLDGKVLREFVKSPSGSWTVTTYVYRGSQLAASMKSGDTPGATRHYHLDHLGTPRLVTDDDGIQKAYHHYYPFGNETSATKDTDQDFRMKFTGHERDVGTANLEQLDYMHARYYSGTTGRFLSVDPGNDSSLRSPGSWNRYAYARNSPILLFDRDGRAVVITISRDTYTENAITSTVNVTSDVKDAGSFTGFALEDARGGKKRDKDPIAAGTYDAFIRTDHNPNRIELEDVPNYENVQIHTGNNNTAVEGCFAVGESRSTDWVSDSAKALNAILKIVSADGSNKITVIVVGASTGTDAAPKPEEKKDPKADKKPAPSNEKGKV